MRVESEEMKWATGSSLDFYGEKGDKKETREILRNPSFIE
jgi:hypothetical protein